MSCFLVTAWEAFAAHEGKTIWQMPVEFMHIEVLQPVRAERTEKVRLSVLFDFSSRFQANFSPILSCSIPPPLEALHVHPYRSAYDVPNGGLQRCTRSMSRSTLHRAAQA